MNKMMLVFLAVVAACLMGCGPSPAGPGTTPGDTGTTPGDTGSPTTTFLNAHWFVARGAPVNTDGVDGDLYLDTESTILYVKTGGAWVAVGTLRGEGGAAGAAGANGSGWLLGAGAPGASLGSNGDLYLDTVSTIAYKKVNGAWAELFGLQGDAGADGRDWITGVGDPNDNPPAGAQVGDLYMDIFSTLVYRLETTGWVVVVFFQAAVVPQFAWTPNGYEMYGAAYGAGKIVAVGQSGAICVSTDGTTWQLLRGGIPAMIEVRMTPAGGAAARVATAGAARGIVSDTGFTGGSDSDLYGVAYGDGRFVAVGLPQADYSIYTSPDGTGRIEGVEGSGWSAAATATPELYLRAVTYAAGMFLACGQSSSLGFPSVILSSVNGNDWTPGIISGSPSDYLRGIAYGSGLFVAVGEFGTILTSADGQNWATDTGGIPGNVDPYLYGITYANEVFVAVGYDDYSSGTALVLVGTVTEEGLVWQSQDLPLNLYSEDSYQAPYWYWYSPLSAVACGTGGFVAVGTAFDCDIDQDGYYNGAIWYTDYYYNYQPHALVLTSPTAASWGQQRWDGYASGICWAPLNGGLYVVARGDARGGRPPPPS